MKKILSFILLSLFAFAQDNGQGQKDIIKFLGMPVDGSKTTFGNELVKKGYTKHLLDDDAYFTGKFNGQNVFIRLVENHGKLYRVFISDDFESDETSIKNRFNVLCRQFENNGRYVDYEHGIFGTTQQIPENEDISYEMEVRSKAYEAAYYQVDTIYTQRMLEDYFGRIDNEDVFKDPETFQAAVASALLTEILPYLQHKCVWFKIVHDSFEKYRIIMFYDNGWNSPNGEDL